MEAFEVDENTDAVKRDNFHDPPYKRQELQQGRANGKADCALIMLNMFYIILLANPV